MAGSHDELIRALRADLAPVRRLWPAPLRAAAWLAVVAAAAAAVALTPLADVPAMMARFAATPDLGLSALGSALTAGLAAWAAFELATPGRDPRWALLPVPAALLWIGASGAGCLRVLAAPGTGPMASGEEAECLAIIVVLSVPLALLMTLMLRRAYALAPALTAAVAGLACAAAAATLLALVHPFDAAALDLALHALGVLLVVAGTTLWGRRALSPREDRVV
jgi:hypothetical protein